MLGYFENLNGMNVDINNDRLKNFNGEIVIGETKDAEYEDFFKAINKKKNNNFRNFTKSNKKLIFKNYG